MSNDRSKAGAGPAAPQGPTRNTLDTDGMLSEWGARLFYPIPKGKGGGGGGKLPLLTTVAALTALMTPNEVRSRVRSTVMYYAMWRQQIGERQNGMLKAAIGGMKEMAKN